MSIKCKKSLISGSVTFFVILSSIFFICTSSALSQEALAPDFQAVDLDGKDVSLSDYRGEVVLLHITNIENPLCRECEHALNAQTSQLSLLAQKDPGIKIITLNVRKNPYSKDGRYWAKAWWNINVTWPWIEDFEPYPLTGKYIDYSTLEGGFANPTLILIDKEGKVAGLYHVYQLGKGEIDGIQSAETLYSDLKGIERGEATGFKGVTSGQNVNYLGMFFLGIITSLSPCSIALLLAMFSYVMTARRKEEYLKKSASASKEGFMIGVAFTLGMAAVFFVVGLFLSDIGVFIRQARFFDLAAGLLMIILGINIIKPIGEIIEPVSSRLSLGREHSDALSGDYCSREEGHHGEAGPLLHGPLPVLGLHWSFHSGRLLCPGLGSLRRIPGLSGAHLAHLPECNDALAGGMMLFVFGVGHGVPVIPIATFSRAVGGQIGEKYISAGKYVTKIFGLAVIVIGLIYAVRYLGFKLW